MATAIAFDEIREQAEIPSLEIDFSVARNKDYCELVNEINPLHFDQEYARALGYKDIVVAGIFTASLFPKLITDWLGGQAVIEKMEMKAGAKRLECDVWSENAAAERLASATILLRFQED